MENKSKICAIICEFNPLHNGHMYTIQKAKQLSGCDFIMAIMSGNFSQRAEPTILDKHKRAKLALLAGCDIVVQIPTPFSTATSEVFARAGVKIANSFINVSHLYFGSENGDIDTLKNIAEFFLNEPSNYKELLKKHLSSGNSYNSSRTKAIKDLVENGFLPKEFFTTIQTSNNILAIEYIKQLILLKSKITPITSKRQGEGYNSELLTEFASATAIRKNISNLQLIKKAIPKTIFEEFKKMLDTQGEINTNLLNDISMYNLKTTNEAELKNIFNVKEGLENKLISLGRLTDSYDKFLDKSSSRRYKDIVIKRIVLNLTLKINKNLIKTIYTNKKFSYIKVLAIKKNDVLKYLQNKSPVLIRTNDTKKLSYKSYQNFSKIEQNADNLYALLSNQKTVSVPYILQQPIFL